MSSQLVFLFSPRNDDCIEMWKLLKKKNILNTLIKINVDDPKHTIPGHVDTLPALLVRGDKMIVGNENIIKYFNIPPPQNNTQNIETNSDTDNNFNYNPNIDKKSSNDNKDNKSLPPLIDVPFSKQNESMFLNSNELGGNWSDTYSFINNDTIQKHSFDFINQDTKKNINNENASRSVKKSALEVKMDKMMSERNQIKPIKRM